MPDESGLGAESPRDVPAFDAKNVLKSVSSADSSGKKTRIRKQVEYLGKALSNPGSGLHEPTYQGPDEAAMDRNELAEAYRALILDPAGDVYRGMPDYAISDRVLALRQTIRQVREEAIREQTESWGSHPSSF